MSSLKNEDMIISIIIITIISSSSSSSNSSSIHLFLQVTNLPYIYKFITIYCLNVKIKPIVVHVLVSKLLGWMRGTNFKQLRFVASSSGLYCLLRPIGLNKLGYSVDMFERI